MRPVDALTPTRLQLGLARDRVRVRAADRRARDGGVVGGDRRGAHRRPTSVRGTVTAITLDIGEADLQIVGGGGQAALQVSHTDRFSFGHPAEAERVVRGGDAAAALALPGRADRQLLVRLPAARARQRAGQGQDHERRRLLQRLPRLGDRRHHLGQTSNFDGWCGFNLQIRADVGRRPRRRLLRARSACSCARAPARCRRSCRPAATASTPRATRASAACAA